MKGCLGVLKMPGVDYSAHQIEAFEGFIDGK